MVEGHAIMVLQLSRESVAHCSESLPRPLGLSHTLNSAVPMFKETVGCRARVDLWLLVMSYTLRRRGVQGWSKSHSCLAASYP